MRNNSNTDRQTDMYVCALCWMYTCTPAIATPIIRTRILILIPSTRQRTINHQQITRARTKPNSILESKSFQQLLCAILLYWQLFLGKSSFFVNILITLIICYVSTYVVQYCYLLLGSPVWMELWLSEIIEINFSKAQQTMPKA